MNTQNFHALTVKYLGCTDTEGYKVSVNSRRFKQHITFKRLDSSANSFIDEIIARLTDRGFNIIGKMENGSDSDILITDTFEPLHK